MFSKICRRLFYENWSPKKVIGILNLRFSFQTELLKCLDCLRLSPLGCDRFHRRYWLFHGASPGLYVEDGWMDKCTLQPVNDKGCIAQDVEDKDCVARDVEDTACVAQDVVVINDDEEGPENCKKDIAPNVVVIDDVDGSGNCKEVVTQNVNAVGDEQTQETTTNCKEDADISKRYTTAVSKYLGVRLYLLVL